MLKKSFILLAALAIGTLGLTGPEATAFPVIIKPVPVSDAASSPIVDVRYNGGGGRYHGNGHGFYPPGYRAGMRPNYRPNSWNYGYHGPRCRSWSNSCRFYYGGWYYNSPWWTVPVVGAQPARRPEHRQKAGHQPILRTVVDFVDRRGLERALALLQQRLRVRVLAGSHRYLEQIQRELAEYFAGARQAFDTPVVLTGSPFQTRVWRALQAIPAGATCSYAELARKIDQPKAVRAVGRANGDNRLSIIVPCHRVIGADGALTGYGGGLARKQKLLDLERAASRLT